MTACSLAPYIGRVQSVAIHCNLLVPLESHQPHDGPGSSHRRGKTIDSVAPKDKKAEHRGPGGIPAGVQTLSEFSDFVRLGDQ
jgi:hypothetical protein